jgi:nitrite reductase/ring-hydroxylating ferredoxin subunit
VAKYQVAKTTDLAPGEMKLVEVSGVPVCVVHSQDGPFYAVNDICSHEETSLAEGWTYDSEIECPRHNAIFDLKTGEAVSLPATEPIATYPVTIEGDDVYISLDVDSNVH